MAKPKVFLWRLGCPWNQRGKRRSWRNRGKAVKNLNDRLWIKLFMEVSRITWRWGRAYRASTMSAIVVLHTYWYIHTGLIVIHPLRAAVWPRKGLWISRPREIISHKLDLDVRRFGVDFSEKAAAALPNGATKAFRKKLVSLIRVSGAVGMQLIRATNSPRLTAQEHISTPFCGSSLVGIHLDSLSRTPYDRADQYLVYHIGFWTINHEGTSAPPGQVYCR